MIKNLEIPYHNDLILLLFRLFSFIYVLIIVIIIIIIIIFIINIIIIIIIVYCNVSECLNAIACECMLLFICQIKMNIKNYPCV